MSARYLVVDGHSVIFAWADLRALHQKNRSAARQALATRLQVLHDSTEWRVTLVLDGTHGSPPGPRQPNEMVTIYASADQTADSIIEQLVAKSGVAPEVLVVTADEAERLMVQSLGASTVSPSWLRDELGRAGADFRDALDRVHRSARWNRTA